jgi:hypothetical protein
MKPSTDQHTATVHLDTHLATRSATLEGLVAAIADSPIVVGRPAVVLPEGFEPIDVAILNWIVAEARRLRGFALA